MWPGKRRRPNPLWLGRRFYCAGSRRRQQACPVIPAKAGIQAHGPWRKATLDAVYIDINAAGHGWFVDPTPGVNEEFQSASGKPAALDPRVVDRMDLLTVVAHELGHTMGLADLDSSIGSLMSGTLESGLRREPGVAEIDALFAQL